MNPPSKVVHTMSQQELTAAEALTTLCRLITSPPPATALPLVQARPIPDMSALLPMRKLPVPAPYVIPPLSTIRPLIQQPSTVKTNSDKSMKKFPQKLLEILETQEHSNILRWLPGGKAFIIDKKRFTNEKLPAFLKHTQYTSFTRKLFRWKFVCVPHGPFMGAYYHKHFRRDHPTLCKLMSCNTNNVPSLAVIAQTRKQAMASIATSPRPTNKNTIDLLSISQQNTLQNLKETNRVFMIKEQILSMRLKKAHHLYDELQKHTLRRAAQQGIRTAPCPLLLQQARHQYLSNQSPYPEQIPRHHTQVSINGNNSSNSSRILQDAYRVLKSDISMDYKNTYMSRLIKR